MTTLFCGLLQELELDPMLIRNMKLPTIVEQERFHSPAPTPQALAWDGNKLWMGSRDLRRIYVIDPKEWKVLDEKEPPGIPWAAVAANGTLWFTIGEGPNDDRYIRRFSTGTGFTEKDKITCPEFTGSYLSYDGEGLYLSQWYKHRILKLDANGDITRAIDIDAEISGHTFVDGLIYVLRGTEQNGENWTIARLDPREEKPEVKDVAIVPFACRSLTFDGEHFWSNYRAKDMIVSFVLPN